VKELKMETEYKKFWSDNFLEAAQCLSDFYRNEENLHLCSQFSDLLIKTLQGGGKIFTCGNGGSHCDAMHFAEELTGRYRKDRRALGALALGDASHTTCVGNDYGFEYIFSRQLQGLARREDLIIGISTSGNSQNIVQAFQAANLIGMKKVALLGRDGGALKTMADLAIIVPGKTSDRIQEMHIKLIHMVIETIERKLFPENYK